MAIVTDLSSHIDENPWKVCRTVAAVGPKGQFCYRHISRNPELRNEQIGSTPIKVRDGEAYIPPYYARQGWVLYEDLCKGKVDGVEANMNAWKLWETIVEARAKGQRLPSASFGDRFLHPEVIRRREIGGLNVASPEDIMRWARVDPSEMAPAPEPEEKPAKKGKR